MASNSSWVWRCRTSSVFSAALSDPKSDTAKEKRIVSLTEPYLAGRSCLRWATALPWPSMPAAAILLTPEQSAASATRAQLRRARPWTRFVRVPAVCRPRRSAAPPRRRERRLCHAVTIVVSGDRSRRAPRPQRQAELRHLPRGRGSRGDMACADPHSDGTSWPLQLRLQRKKPKEIIRLNLE